MVENMQKGSGDVEFSFESTNPLQRWLACSNSSKRRTTVPASAHAHY